MNHIYLNWDNIEKSCLSIYSRMCNDKYVPDMIVGLLWGGVVPTRLFVDFFGVSRSNVKVVYASLYKGIHEQNDSLTILPYYSKEDVANKKVLVIDDIWDTGKTMKSVLSDLIQMNCTVTTATIVYRTGYVKPNYFDITVRDEWVVFPWERYEFWREIHK